MTRCPECDTELDLDEDEVEEGEILSCTECDAELEVTQTHPVHLIVISDDEDEEEDDDEEESVVGKEEEEEEEDEAEEFASLLHARNVSRGSSRIVVPVLGRRFRPPCTIGLTLCHSSGACWKG